jgi:O-antigen ligase
VLASRQFGAIGASAALLLLAAGAGLAAAVQPTLGIGLAFGIVFALITLSDVTAGLILFTALSFLDVLTNTGGALAGFAKVAGGLLFGSWYARRLVGEPRVAATAPRLAPGLTVCLVVLAAWSALSVVWAQDPNVAISSTMSFVLNMLLFPIVLVAVQRREQLIRVMGAFVAGAVLSTAYGLAQPAAVGAGDYGRLTGSLGDANDQAAVLVAAIPLAIGLALAVKQPWARNLALLGGAVCVLGLINTLSRGGLVALGAVLVSAVVFGGRWRAKALLLLVLGSAGTVAYFALVAPGAARDRVTMASSSGRADLWRVGWRIVAAHPFNGVGSGNFQGAAVHYVQTAGILTSAYLIVDVPHVAHNAYLEVLADLGVPGLVPFLGIALFSLFASAQAARAFQREGDAQLEVLARSLVLAVVGLLTADFFLSGQFSKQLWLTFALCAAAPGISRRDPNAGSGFTRG